MVFPVSILPIPSRWHLHNWLPRVHFVLWPRCRTWSAYARPGAYQNGQTEEWLGEWIEKRGIRDDLVIASKYSLSMKKGSVNRVGNHRKNMFQSLDDTLKRLRTSFVDIYYVHFWDYTTSVEDIMRALDDLVRSGKVHHVAISDAPAWVVSQGNTIARLRGWSPFVLYQGRYHIGSRDMEREVFPMAKELNIAIAPWGVLGQGKFTGKVKRGEDTKARGGEMSARDFDIQDVVLKVAQEVNRSASQVTLNWAISKGTFPIIGIRNLDQLKDNLAALEFTLTADQMKRLDDVSKPELGFPHDFLGGVTTQENNWLKLNGTKIV